MVKSLRSYGQPGRISGHEGQVRYQGLEKILGLPGVTPHIYGKRLTRPFRKMGHVTIVDPSISQARKRAREVKENCRLFQSKNRHEESRCRYGKYQS